MTGRRRDEQGDPARPEHPGDLSRVAGANTSRMTAAAPSRSGKGRQTSAAAAATRGCSAAAPQRGLGDIEREPERAGGQGRARARDTNPCRHRGRRRAARPAGGRVASAPASDRFGQRLEVAGFEEALTGGHHVGGVARVGASRPREQAQVALAGDVERVARPQRTASRSRRPRPAPQWGQRSSGSTWSSASTPKPRTGRAVVAAARRQDRGPHVAEGRAPSAPWAAAADAGRNTKTAPPPPPPTTPTARATSSRCATSSPPARSAPCTTWTPSPPPAPRTAGSAAWSSCSSGSAVRWTIAGLPLEGQRELLGRYRLASSSERQQVRETLAKHLAARQPEIDL